MVLVEAMACGTPCVASRTGGIVDIVENGVNGYLATPGDAAELATGIIRLLKNERMQREMGIAGRWKVEEGFSVTAVTQQVIAIYQSVLNGRS